MKDITNLLNIVQLYNAFKKTGFKCQKQQMCKFSKPSIMVDSSDLVNNLTHTFKFFKKNICFKGR